MPRTVLCLVSIVPLLAGCMGSPNPYKPGYEPRPPEVTPETQVETAQRQAIPSDVVRRDWRRRLAEREISGIVEFTHSRNAWFAYEADMLEVLGPEESARYLGGRAAGAMPEPVDEDASSGDEGGDDYGDEYGDDGGDDYGDEYGD
ncbi:MAG: hypothetical protein R3F62_05225 [Planctomycetota bacterium]